MDKFDLTTPKLQSFSLPLPFIRYIFESDCSLRTSENLIQSCKTLKLWQLQTPGCFRIKNIEIFEEDLEVSTYNHKITFEIQNNDIIKLYQRIISQIDDNNKIKVMGLFYLNWSNQLTMNQLLLKLDFSKTKELDIDVYFELTLYEYNVLFQSFLLSIKLNAFFPENANPVLLAFKRCPKLHTFSIVEYNNRIILAKEDFKKLLNFEQKMEECWFYAVSEIDPVDFVEFADTMLAEHTGRITLHFNNLQSFNNLKNAIEKISKSREKEQLTFHRGVLRYSPELESEINMQFYVEL